MRKHTEKQCSHHTLFNKLKPTKFNLKRNSIHLHGKLFQEMQEIEKHLISLKRESEKIYESSITFQNTPILHIIQQRKGKKTTD